MEILKAWALDNLKRFHMVNQVLSKTNLISSPNLYHRMTKKNSIGFSKMITLHIFIITSKLLIRVWWYLSIYLSICMRGFLQVLSFKVIWGWFVLGDLSLGNFRDREEEREREYTLSYGPRNSLYKLRKNIQVELYLVYRTEVVSNTNYFKINVKLRS